MAALWQCSLQGPSVITGKKARPCRLSSASPQLHEQGNEGEALADSSCMPMSRQQARLSARSNNHGRRYL